VLLVSLEESKESLGSRAPLLLFTLQVAALVRTVGAALSPNGLPLVATASSVLPPVATVVAPNGVPLYVEWAEFFAQGIYSILLPLFLQVSSGKVSTTILKSILPLNQ
jgi:hypothetical protein